MKINVSEVYFQLNKAHKSTPSVSPATCECIMIGGYNFKVQSNHTSHILSKELPFSRQDDKAKLLARP